MAENDDSEVSRAATLADLTRICNALNRKKVKYMLIGGFAVNYYGFSRATTDVDFLVDASTDNIEKLKEALHTLGIETDDMPATDVETYTVVRIVEEVTIDLLKSVGDINFSNAKAITAVADGISIPVADIPTLIETKRGIREKDKIDLGFLIRVLNAQQQNTIKVW